MHYHAELVMPPAVASNEDTLEATIGSILEPFDQNRPDSRHAFFDYWGVGGRYSGSKIQAAIGEQALADFKKWIVDSGVTVSALQFGKQSLQPEGQAEAINAEWSRRFPKYAGVCPLFDNYKAETLDICCVDEIPEELECGTLIIAAPGYSDGWEVSELLLRAVWNGVSWQETTFDGNVLEGIREWNAMMSERSNEWAKTHEVRSNWLCVTLDYHS